MSSHLPPPQQSNLEIYARHLITKEVQSQTTNVRLLAITSSPSKLQISRTQIRPNALCSREIHFLAPNLIYNNASSTKP